MNAEVFMKVLVFKNYQKKIPKKIPNTKSALLDCGISKARIFDTRTRKASLQKPTQQTQLLLKAQLRNKLRKTSKTRKKLSGNCGIPQII